MGHFFMIFPGLDFRLLFFLTFYGFSVFLSALGGRRTHFSRFFDLWACLEAKMAPDPPKRAFGNTFGAILSDFGSNNDRFCDDFW